MNLSNASSVTGPLTTMQQEILEGLSESPKTIASKYFYDARGCELFDAICELPDYYPTRTELAIMRASAEEMAKRIGPHAVLIEYGSGASVKTRLLLDALHEPNAYVPLDIASEHLQETADQLQQQYPNLAVCPVQADFTRPVELPDTIPAGRRVVYFPGSTIGNLRPPAAVRLLRNVADMCPHGGMLLGIDLRKPAPILQAAYDDSAGVTAEFNRNILSHLNREAGTDFEIEAFQHRALFDSSKSRVEMHLDATRDTGVTIGGVFIPIKEGENIRTELSHKYDLATFPAMAREAGMEVQRVWTDPKQWFAVVWLTPED